MSAINDSNFIAIQGWMRNKLNLKGNELIIYALIFGFSQDGHSRFKGSRKYIADWCGCSLDTVDRTLGSLVDKGFIAKYPHQDEYGTRHVDYAAILAASAATPAPATNPAATPAPVQDAWADATNATPGQSQQPVARSATKPQPKKTRKTRSFDDIIDAYTSDPTTKDLLGAWLQNRKAKRAAMTDRAIQSNLDKLDEYARNSHMNVNDYLNEVIRRGWSAFFTIDNYKRPGTQQQRQPQQQNPWYDTPEAQRQYENDIKEWEEHCVFRL